MNFRIDNRESVCIKQFARFSSEPAESRLLVDTFQRPILMSFHLPLGLTSGLSSSRFPTETMYAFLFSFTHDILSYWILLLLLLLFLVICLFSLVFLLFNQLWSPPLRLQVSDCSTLRIMCDVTSTAVFCTECIECFPGMASKFSLKPFVTISVAPIITDIIIHFTFYIYCISIHKFLCFSLLFFVMFLSADIATFMSKLVFYCLFSIIISAYFYNVSVCISWFHYHHHHNFKRSKYTGCATNMKLIKAKGSLLCICTPPTDHS